MSTTTRGSASVSLVDPMIDTASDTFAVEIELPNTQYLLPAGLKCSVSFPGSMQ